MSRAGETAFLTGAELNRALADSRQIGIRSNNDTQAVPAVLAGQSLACYIKVFLVDINAEGAQSVANELNEVSKAGQLAWSAQCDVSDWDSQRSAFEQAIDVLDGRIDYVLPIAGIGERRSFPNKPDATTFEKPDLKVVEVDEIGVIYSVSLAVQHLRQVGKGKRGVKGRILVVASVCGFYIHTTIPLYTAAKHAIVGLVRSYGAILAEERIHLNALCPNKIRTGISTAAVYEKAEKAGVLVPMEKLLEAFEKLLSGGEYGGLSGECIEVAPKLGVRRREFVGFVNEESRVSAEMTYERSHFLHEVVED